MANTLTINGDVRDLDIDTAPGSRAIAGTLTRAGIVTCAHRSRD